MRAKVTNGAFVAVVVLLFSVYVAGLNDSTDPVSVTTEDESEDGVTFHADGPSAGGEEGLTFWADGSYPGETAERGSDTGGDATTNATPTPTRTPTPVNIGNFVWNDLDDDGRQDAGEPGMEGVTVQLWNPAKTSLIDQTTTNSNGNYTLVTPTPGDFRVRVVLPSINDAFTGKDLAGGSDLLDSDINPSGANIGFTDIISIASNVISITSIDAGIQKFATPTPTRTPTPVNIGNFVWNDLDDDGRQDAGEPGMEGVTVQLWNPAKTTLIDQDTTNSNGNYTLVTPTPGDFRVRVVLPSISDVFTGKDLAGGSDLLDSDINPSGANIGFTDSFTIASNVISITSIDAGIQKFATPTPTRTPTPINIGNFVWDDLDEDGIQDGGEPGIAGITVQLWNAAKTDLLDQDTTNGSGNYTLVAPLPGDYRVRVVLPTLDAGFTIENAGSNDQVDSDINPAGANIGFTDVYTFASNLISITTIDAGLIGDTTVPTSTTTTEATTTTESTTTTEATTTTTEATTTTTEATTTTTDDVTTTTDDVTTTTDDVTTTTDDSTSTTIDETTTTEPTTTTTEQDGEPGATYDDGTTTATVERGGAVKIVLEGAEPGSDVEVTLYSDPVVLGTVAADDEGGFLAPFTIPAGTALGDHEIGLTGTDIDGDPFDLRLDLKVVADDGVQGGGTDRTPTDVDDGDLARTGTSGVAELISVGLLSALGGAVLLLLARGRARGRTA